MKRNGRRFIQVLMAFWPLLVHWFFRGGSLRRFWQYATMHVDDPMQEAAVGVYMRNPFIPKKRKSGIYHLAGYKKHRARESELDRLSRMGVPVMRKPQ